MRSRNIKSFHAAINPKLINNKETFLIKLRLAFPELPIKRIEKKLDENKYFYLKKRLNQVDKEKFWRLGEKGIIFEPFQTRVYTHSNLFSHVIGQVDYDNFGISGIEKYFDKDLRNKDLINYPLKLTLDANIQYMINSELKNLYILLSLQEEGLYLWTFKPERSYLWSPYQILTLILEQN